MNVFGFSLMALLAAVAYSEGIVIDADFCGNKLGEFCENCLQPVHCDGAGALMPLPACSAGNACVEVSGLATCKPEADTICSCKETGDQCDAYNPDYIMKCLQTGPFDIVECPLSAGGDRQLCLSGTCQVPPCAMASPQSWVLIIPSCTDAVYCNGDSIASAYIHCSPGQYVDDLGMCSPAPPRSCEGQCTEDFCPNPLDCEKFDICVNGSLIITESCDDGASFDPTMQECVEEATNVTCPATDGCIFDSVSMALEICDQTTEGNYPVADCSQGYMTCHEGADGVPGFTFNSCLGDQYFDPASQSCTDREHITGCHWWPIL